MAKIKIVTDSSIQLTDEEAKKYEIHVIPLTIMIDNTVYVDGETIGRTEFMEKMATANALPKTSQPAIGSFIDLFDQLGVDGSQVLAIHMLAAISGTVNTARQAAEISKSDVTVVDSDFTDRALSFQVITAAKMAQAGAQLPEILDQIKQIREHTHLFMGVVNLSNLVKGGRLSKTSGLISSLLNIKVMLEVRNGSLDVIRKGRGMKTITNFVDGMEQDMQKLSNIVAIGISHADGLGIGTQIYDRLKASFPTIPILLRATDPVIATYSGAGAFAVMYYTEN